MARASLQSKTKKVISYSLVLGQQPLTALQIKNLIKVFQCFLKSIKNLLIQNCFYGNTKNINKTKIARTKTDLTTDS